MEGRRSDGEGGDGRREVRKEAIMARDAEMYTLDAEPKEDASKFHTELVTNTHLHRSGSRSISELFFPSGNVYPPKTHMKPPHTTAE